MRTEQQMLALIIRTAQNDERIRAVIMNGSRTNPDAPRDIFQDFDIVYVVTDVRPFRDDPTWINRFGERMILQMPEAMEDPPPQNTGIFIYLMLFADGNRIDLGLFPLDMASGLGNDSLSVLLLDKDGLFPPFPLPSDKDYLPQPPSAKLFADCCNEFWWLCPNIAKGLWREEILYAKHMFEHHSRAQLLKMLIWAVGIKTNFARSPGKFGKYLRRYLEPEDWALLEKTYADANYDRSWDALFTMCELFRRAARRVADHCGYIYPVADDEKVSVHLRHVRALPKSAKTIY